LAYQTLTKKKMYDNWMLHGDPNGTQTAKAMGLAIPTWLFDEEWRTIMVPSMMMGVAAIALYIHQLTNNIRHNCSNGISINSRLEMEEVIVAILTDNDAQQQSKGLSAIDWIDVFEVSAEAAKLNDEFAAKRAEPFKKVVAGLIVGKKKVKATESDGCCEDDSPQAKILMLLPRLNEVILGDIIVELSEGGKCQFKWNRERMIKSLHDFMISFSGFKKAYSLSRRSVEMDMDCDGQKGNFQYSDVLSIKVTVTKSETAKTKPLPYESQMFICCIN